MAPIYLPPSFCGKNAKLQVKKDLLLNDLFLSKDTICNVQDIVGYAYIILPVNSSSQVTFRIKDGLMDKYFYLLDRGIKPWVEEDARVIRKNNIFTVTLKKELVIKDVVTLKAGTEFFPIKDITNDGKVFWNLYDGKTYERTLRLPDDEFKVYF
ncbi:MAG: hypothetical protein ABRQ27_04360 [Clostridiaceae bacterium]